MDFLDKSSDDFVLSQALELFESATNTFDDANITHEDLCLSQTLETVEKNNRLVLTDSQFTSVMNEVKHEIYGNFECDLPSDMDIKPPCGDAEGSHSGRFGDSVSNLDLDELVMGQRSKNTDRNTQWAYNAFEAWRKERNDTGEYIPELASEELDVNIHLARFVVEVWNQNGEYFPPESVYHLVCGLLRKLRDNGIVDKNFLDEKNPNFARFRKVLDAQMKFLTKEGICMKKREAQPVSEEDEIVMWEKGVFGDKNAMTLQYTVFFYNCKLFGLRGYDEHRDLETNQFEFGSDENGKFMIFTGKNSKTYNGGLKHRRIEAKTIKHYNNNQNIVGYYELYVEVIGDRAFYKRALSSSATGGVRFSNQVVGVNKLKTFMKEICKQAGLEGRYTNHSGKKTCATTLYQQDVPEHEIMKRTGHRSVAGVRKYQKANNAMLVDISNKLNPPERKPSEQTSSVSPKTENPSLPSSTVTLETAESVTEVNYTNGKEKVSRMNSGQDVAMFRTGHNVYNNCVFKF